MDSTLHREQMQNIWTLTPSSEAPSPMLTRRIDAALESLWTCRERLPLLRDLFLPGTPERGALDGVVAAIEHADKVLHGRETPPPAGLG